MNNEIYTHTVCPVTGSSVSGWLMVAIFMIPVILVVVDALEGVLK